MGAMSACIGMMNSNSVHEAQFNFDSQNNFTLGDKRRRYRLQQRSNSQVFVPLKKDDDFTVPHSSSKKNSNKKMGSDGKIKNIEKNHEKEKIINNSVMIDNHYKKLIGKNKVSIKKKLLNNSDDNCDIIECDDEFEFDNNITNYIKNTDILSTKKSNFLQNQNHNSKNNNNAKTIKAYTLKQENGKENENEYENNNNGILNESYNNKDLNMELSISKNKITINDAQRSTIFGNLINNEENGGKTLDNDNNNKNFRENNINKENKKEENKIKENKLFVIKDYYDGGITNLKHNRLFKITKANNISFSDKNEGIRKVIEDSYSNLKENKNMISPFDFSQKKSNIKSSNKKKIDFTNCKIDNNINFNIDNSNLNNNNNNLNNNINNVNNINNISSINSDFNNNNFIDVSSNMTYFLSLEKSQRKQASSRFDSKVFSYRKNNNPNSNASFNSKEVSSNNYRNSVRDNKYKWKLLPRQKYNTQVYKSLNNIPLLQESKSSLINETETKNLNLTLKKNSSESNKFFSEIKRQKEQQDKVIKSLENKINNLEKKINEEKNKEEENNQKIIKLEEYIDKKSIKKNKEKNIKENLINDFNKMSNYNTEEIDSILLEDQKDFRIKKLEEQLNKVKKNNKMNQTLLKKKNKQIQDLLNSKNKQDEIIKQYESMKNNIPKNNNFTTKGNKKISYLDDISNSMSTNNIYSNSNHNLTESKISFSEFRNYKNSNSNNSINILKDKNKKTHKKENSITIRKNFFKHNTSNLNDFFGLVPKNEIKVRESLKENTKLKLNKNSNVKNTNKFNANNNKNSSNVSYYNYCNDLTNKSKNNYNTKITLNKMKMYRLNTALNLTLNNDNKANKLFKAPTNGTTKGKKEEINLNVYNTNTTTSKTTRKKFSFTKSKKLIKKNSGENLTEMYLKAGTIKSDENNVINNYSNYNHVKSFSYNEIPLFSNKNSFTNSNNNTTVTNKNSNDNNLSLCPLLLPSNFPNKNHIESISIEDNLNLSANINNIHISNPGLKSNSNEQKNEMKKLYQKLWNEGFLRYKQLNENSQNEENNIYKLDDGLIRIKICMANELYEIKADKEDSMGDIKNKFLDIFFEEKTYGEKEKRYIDNNIIFLNKEGDIDINKKVKEMNLENNEIIIPVLKDVTY